MIWLISRRTEGWACVGHHVNQTLSPCCFASESKYYQFQQCIFYPFLPIQSHSCKVTCVTVTSLVVCIVGLLDDLTIFLSCAGDTTMFHYFFCQRQLRGKNVTAEIALERRRAIVKNPCNVREAKWLQRHNHKSLASRYLTNRPCIEDKKIM